MNRSSLHSADRGQYGTSASVNRTFTTTLRFPIHIEEENQVQRNEYRCTVNDFLQNPAESMENRKRPFQGPRLLWRTSALPFNADLDRKVWNLTWPRQMGPQSTGAMPCVLEDSAGSGAAAKKSTFFRRTCFFQLFWDRSAGCAAAGARTP